MNVDLYERIWMWGVAVMLSLFFISTAAAAFGSQIHPPSHVETIDPRTALTDDRFKQQGVTVTSDGRVHATIVGLMFAWLPQTMTLPADTPITFRLTSADVIHGYQIVRTNGQSMVVPGYVSQFTVSLAAGEYVVACNEYCGIGHHTMITKLQVVPAAEWRKTVATTTAPAEASHDH